MHDTPFSRSDDGGKKLFNDDMGSSKLYSRRPSAFDLSDILWNGKAKATKFHGRPNVAATPVLVILSTSVQHIHRIEPVYPKVASASQKFPDRN